MRPTVEEQLRETRRILADALTPLIADAYTRQIVDLALANLAMLEDAWVKVLPFLSHDNAAALALLRAVSGDVPTAVADAIGAVGALPACDPFDPAGLNARNERLQAIVADAALAAGPAGRRLIQAYLLDRTARYPMRPALGRSAKPAAARAD